MESLERIGKLHGDTPPIVQSPGVRRSAYLPHMIFDMQARGCGQGSALGGAR
jgi:hypothetical protein